MRVLLDECLPRRLKRDLVVHDVKTAPEMGWAGKKNGTLLTLAAIDFDIVLTSDQNLALAEPVCVRCRRHRLHRRKQPHRRFAALVPRVLELLTTVRPGTVTVVKA